MKHAEQAPRLEGFVNRSFLRLLTSRSSSRHRATTAPPSWRGLSLALLVATSASACSGGADGGTPSSGGTSAGGSGATSGVSGMGAGGSATCDAPTGSFSITDDTNYSIPSSMSVKTYTLKDHTDLVFDWGSLTHDFYGRAVDPKLDIELVLLSLWKKTPTELEAALASDKLSPNDNVGVITTYPMDEYTSQNLLNFNFAGNPIPNQDELWQYFDTQNPRFMYPPDQYTFLVEAGSSTVLGKDARMLAFFNLDPASNATSLTLEDDSASLSYSVHLTTARPIRVPVATPELKIDWSKMTTNAVGNEFDGTQINQAVVAHFAHQTLADLEQQFLDLRTLADGWWSAPVLAGKSIDLATLVDENTTPFPGIDAQGVWLTALFCTTNCNNPAPWSITVLEPCL
jgi:hypothetical protein